MPSTNGNKSRAMMLILPGIILLAGLLAVAIVLLAPDTASSRAPLLLAAFIIVLIVSFLSIILLLRRLLRPYKQLVGEAERAQLATQPSERGDEGQFVLETFKSVVAQLQAQQRELESLSAEASARAVSAEKFSERIVASVPSGLIAFDANGNATVVNSPARALIEAGDAVEGLSPRELLRNAPDLAEMVENCLATGEVYRREESMVTGSNGHVRRLGATVAPIDPAAEQEGRGALCLITDLTEVLQLREQVALKRNLESLGEMSAGLAHEFKNALATLHGYSQLIQTLTLDENGRIASTALLHEVRNLSEMVTAFLNFARPQPLELAPTSLAALIEECRTELQSFYQERRIELLIEGEFVEVAADERMLRQALLNLLRNAAEAITDDSTSRVVKVSGACSRGPAGNDCVLVSVRDSGEGIQSSDLQRIFIPFFTTKSKGHGVGLALAHRVITDHGGTLVAANAPEGGAVFTIRLPR